MDEMIEWKVVCGRTTTLLYMGHMNIRGISSLLKRCVASYSALFTLYPLLISLLLFFLETDTQVYKDGYDLHLESKYKQLSRSPSLHFPSIGFLHSFLTSFLSSFLFFSRHIFRYPNDKALPHLTNCLPFQTNPIHPSIHPHLTYPNTEQLSVWVLSISTPLPLFHLHLLCTLLLSSPSVLFYLSLSIFICHCPSPPCTHTHTQHTHISCTSYLLPCTCNPPGRVEDKRRKEKRSDWTIPVLPEQWLY